MTSRQGRVRLDRIAAEWAEESVINPPMLASELAAVLRSVSPENQPIHEAYVSALLSSNPSGAGAITFGALAAYFDEVGQSKAPHTIATLSGCVPASVVTVARIWIGRLVTDAAERAAFAAGYVIPANDCPSGAMVSNASPVASLADQPLPPSGSEPGYLKMREAQQRREGENSAAEQLDAERTARQLAEQELEQQRVTNIVTVYRMHQAQLESYELRQKLDESERERVKLTEQLREHTGIIEFMNQDNPLSPVEGRRGVSAWCELTENGTLDPVAENGIGIGTLVQRWWRDRFGEPAGSVVKHLQWMLAWPARKNGGMVVKRQREKG